MPLSPGTRLGAFEIIAPLGAGGMGEVYRARDTRLDRDVAVKVLPERLAQDAERLARFEREAKVLASLNHPNIAQIYGVEDRALIMELVEGANLQGPLPRETAVRYAAQIADALEAAHEKGIVHRDLKPANVMITPAGMVKVLDFGLAAVPLASRAAAGDSSDSQTLTIAATQAGMIMGTAGYMSPEQAAGKPVDRRADIWSFGVVFWEMLTGQPLFSGETVSHTLADVLRKNIELNELPADTPPVLRTLLGRCLERDVRKRLRDIGEARVTLEGPLITNQPPALTVPAAPARPAIWPWLAAAVLALGIPAAWFLKPAPQAPLLQLEILPPPGVSMGPTYWGQLAVSPDGTMIVFVARDRDGRNKLFLRHLNSGSSIAVPGTEGADVPFWSPDSRQIAFLAEGRLKRWERSGNRVLDICEAQSGVYGMWHGDGNIYLSTGEHILRRVRAAGGDLTPVFPSAEQTSLLGASPATIPGETSFLYQALNPSRVLLVSADATIRKQLLPNATSSGGPASFAASAAGGWLLHHTGTDLAAMPFDPRSGDFRGEEVIIAQKIPSGPSWSASNNGVLAYRQNGWGDDRKLTWVDRAGTPGASIGEKGNVFTQRISPDQKSVVFTRISGAGTLLYLYDLARGTTTRVSAESSSNHYAEWMPDSKSVIYSVGKEALAQHVLFAASGEKILQKTGRLTPTGVSPDGKWLASVLIVVGQTSMVLTSLETGKNIALGEEMKLKTHHGSFSPDGRWLLYSAFVNGRWDVFVRPVPAEVLGKAANGAPDSSGQLQISQSGGNQPMWRADGKEIFYIASGGMLTAVPVEVSPTSVRPGTPVPLFQTNLGMDDNFHREYDATADGKRFLLPLPPSGVQSEVPITVIINWPKLMEKK